jgi:uncharacterized damage-inducible protein DinB
MQSILGMYDHVKWANARILDAIARTGEASDYVTTLLHHVLRAEQVWQLRLKGQDSSHLPLWRSSSLQELAALLQANEQDYSAYLGNLDESWLDQMISYRNQSGQPFTTSVRDILIHVALHGSYHRGQINAALRREGHEPVNVDYITFVRTR